MTFDDWMLIKDKSYVPTDDSMSLRLLRECWFSRDAEVAELVAALEAVIPEVAGGNAGLIAYNKCKAALAKVRKP